MTATYRACLAATVVGLAVGCAEKPRAPALTREAVYRNDKLGLRFAAPDGWPIHSKADLPPGKLAKPVVLVSYLSPKGPVPTWYQVEAANAVPDEELAAFLTANPIGGDRWVTKVPPAKVTVNGVEAVRVVLARTGKPGEMLREVTMFRRGERSYLFVIAYDTADRDSRDQARQSVASVQWE